MTKNVNTDQLNRTYEQIEDLQNLMKQYEQKGYEFSTISELRKANKNGTIANIDAIFAKYGVSPTTQQKKSTYSDYEKILYGR
jgi:predicted regulator of amino acid metabolism with ACT domain